jgi:DNA repair protein RadC
MALYLDGAHQPIAYRVVSSGLQNSSQVHPREVLQPALMVGAVSMIVAHNHPSGNTTPSEQDRRVTEAIRDSAKLVGISLLDHLIITEKEHHSFQEQGMI